MLDTDTKRRIDTARDILVGKVPDPKSQVEQITIALIYKFMDDMDADAEEMGGKRKFFTGDFTRYGWTKLMHSGLGGHETLNLYAEGISKMPENPGIPSLFRDIFKNAYLPYRDPETLKSFLKIIDEFTYDHSERLGDAFEYLLSVLGSQGDAGQFRTPRHIIDFIVEIIDPKKNETILDPACGTAGFLISAYKHILRSNTDEKGRVALTPDEKGRIVKSIQGYDISPDMVRLSRANLYLHGFANPNVVEYDTLTSEERWNETADIVLANPPFMSPTGGIKPHKRFSIQAKRSEVLFVDYIAEHLTPNGRAGVIVPEGIIFQTQTAYSTLRKMLVEKYLVAVVSLPAGVFNPYSGVKTSILILDKPLAKKSDSVAFFKIESDGFDLGAQRRSMEKNDLPQVKYELAAYLTMLRSGTSTASFKPNQALMVAKEQISGTTDYNLSGERYRIPVSNSLLKWPLVRIGELCVIERGASPRPIHDFITNAADGINWVKIGDAKVGSKYISETAEKVSPAGAAKSRYVKPGDFLLSNSMSFGRPYIMATDGCIHDGWLLLRDTSDALNRDYLYQILSSKEIFAQFQRLATGGVVNNLNSELVRNVQIPLPPLEVQKEIVAEIEGYQKVIDGANAVLDNYHPHIPIQPEWPMVELGKVARLLNGRAYKQEELLSEGPTPVLRVGNFFSNRSWYYSDLKLEEDKYCNEGDLLYAWSASFGPRIWEGPRAIYHYHIWKIETSAEIEKKFLYYLLEADSAKIKSEGNGIAMMHATKGGMEQRKFPIPPIPIQQGIVAEIEAEQALVAANRDLIKRLEQKIQVTMARIWGGGKTPVMEA